MTQPRQSRPALPPVCAAASTETSWWCIPRRSDRSAHGTISWPLPASPLSPGKLAHLELIQDSEARRSAANLHPPPSGGVNASPRPR